MILENQMKRMALESYKMLLQAFSYFRFQNFSHEQKANSFMFKHYFPELYMPYHFLNHLNSIHYKE